MAKSRNKSYKRLDRRIKSWNETCKVLGADKARGYRKPGSMKK